MAPVGQVLGRDLFSKTKMCKFHRVGKCTKGKQCPWAHDASELQAAPDLRRTKLCKELIATGQCTNPDCNFAHNKEEWRTVARATDGVTHSAQTAHLQQNQVPAKKISVSKAIDAGKTSAMHVPDFVPSSLCSDAPGFIPMNFTAEMPAFLPMRSPPPFGLQAAQQMDGNTPISQILAMSLAPKKQRRSQRSSSDVPAFVPVVSSPPGLEGCTSYSPTWGYQGFRREESISDSSSNDGIKMDGNTLISQILAASTSLDKRSSQRQLSTTDFASVSTAGSLVDLQLSPELLY